MEGTIHGAACRDDEGNNDAADGTVVVVDDGNSRDGTSEERDYI